MAEIVDIRAYRNTVAEQKGFGPWRKRFGESYDQNTTLSDLSDTSLYFLATPGEEHALAFYELIMGILGTGEALKFYYLEKQEQMMVMDIHLFMADQVRFEMLRRLGWLDSFACENHALLEMVRNFDKVKIPCKSNPPKLAKSHPEYAAYKQLSRMDKDVFIRRMLPKSLEAFKKKHGL